MNIILADIMVGNLDGTIIGLITTVFPSISIEIIMAGTGVLFIIAHLVDRKYSYPWVDQELK